MLHKIAYSKMLSIFQSLFRHIIQLFDEVEKNVVIYQWRADQLFADAEG